MKSKIYILILLAFIFTTCQKENQPPTIEITSPNQGVGFVKGEKITIAADAKDPDGKISEVRFFINDVGVSSVSSFPYKYEWNTGEATPGTQKIKAVAVDDENLEAQTSIDIVLEIYSPTLTTDEIKDITSSEALCLGEVTNDGGSTVNERGFCWSENPSPNVHDNKMSAEKGLGKYEAKLENLKPGTTYFVRAYAINDAGTAYGGQISFTTAAIATLPTVITTEASGITSSSAILGGNVTSDGNAPVTDRGIIYSTTPNVTNNNTKISIGNGQGAFNTTATGLTPNTTYYTRAYAINSQGTVYGSEVSFTTSQVISLPGITTAAATSITTNNVVLGGIVNNDGNTSVTERGVVLSTEQNPSITDTKIAIGVGMGAFNTTVTELKANTNYYVRAYAINSQGIAYGTQITFITNKILSLPAVTTQSATDITSNSATLGGNVTSDGNATVTERGIVYSTSQNPTTANTKVIIGSGTGTFSANVTGLKDNTNYYVRAYAINSQGTAYGESTTFTTSKILSLATVTTDPASGVTTDSAILGGNATSDGNATVTEKGIVYGTTQNPTTANTKITKGSGPGTFNATVTGLTPNTTYYARAYAINSQGTAFGTQVSFTTNKVLSLAKVTTSAATDITCSSANLGGNVTEDGNATVTEKGIVYSTSQNPTIGNAKVVMGNSIGVFSGNITGLIANTTYYVRGFATNSQGTAYGPEISLQTEQISLATVITTEASEITSSSAILGGEVTEDGNATITEKGIVYSTSQNPTTSNTKVVIGSSTGLFSGNVSGLIANTTYYVRAFAANSQGAAYGENISFTTSYLANETSSFIDTRGGVTKTYKTVKIGTQWWMAENLAYLPSVSTPTASSFTAPHYYVYAYSGTDVAAAKQYANYTTYGVLYNWPAAKAACPPGWHLPTDDEWKQLEMALGMTQAQADATGFRGTNQGTQMKTTSGFSALLGGFFSFFEGGAFAYIGDYGGWWSSTELSINDAWIRNQYPDVSFVGRQDRYKAYGFSVRCVRD